MIKSNYELEVLVNGKPVKEYLHNGKHFIEGRKDSTFSLRIKNNSWQRKLFVPTIDGLSVMNGEDADLNSGGYIVNGHNSITIDGWRLSNQEVAEFYFSSPKDSYRKKMKKGNNIGVIGLAVFGEKYKQVFNYRSQKCIPLNNHQFTCDVSMDSVLTTSSFNVSSDLGTGFGKEIKSEVVEVEFDRENHADTVFEMFYNTREQLQKMGISFKKVVHVTPQAFPGKYCERP